MIPTIGNLMVRSLFYSFSTLFHSHLLIYADHVGKESLSNLYKTIQNATLGIDGSDVHNRRQSAMATSHKLQIDNKADLEKGRHLVSLQRTLKVRKIIHLTTVPLMFSRMGSPSLKGSLFTWGGTGSCANVANAYVETSHRPM